MNAMHAMGRTAADQALAEMLERFAPLTAENVSEAVAWQEARIRELLGTPAAVVAPDPEPDTYLCQVCAKEYDGVRHPSTWRSIPGRPDGNVCPRCVKMCITASHLIEEAHKALPVAPVAPAPVGITLLPATPKQLEFLGRLVNERAVTDAIRTDAARPDLSKAAASRLIEAALRCPVAAPKVDAPAAPPVSGPGLYRRDDKIYKVQRSRQSGNLYAKVLVPITGPRLNENDEVVHWTFEYVAGAIRSLTESDRLTLEQAKAFGIQHGYCCVCGKRLDDAKSVAEGIGPVCAKRMGRDA